MKTFEELGLRDEILRAISEQGYEYPMPIQEAVIPQFDGSRDLIALAQTGTGKTAAYGLPLIQLLSEQGSQKSPSALVLAPTRELCLQIADDLEGFSKYLPGLRILPVYGGANIEPQIRALHRGVDIIVATPGRLIDLMKRGAADMTDVSTIILDEADEMLSMGFQEDLDTILEGVSNEHHTLLFSATMSKEIEHIAQGYLNEPEEIQVGSRNEGAEHVNHVYYMVRAQDKYPALKRVVDYYPRIYAIIFCRTRMETQDVADKLIQDGYNADALHGDLSQQQRDLTMQKFRQHRTQLLVATDVAARGLDVDDLTHVINYGLPDDVENYTHRSGRTGRAGKKGTSISIVHVREKNKIRTIEKVIQKDFERGTLPSGKDICQKQLYKVVDDIERVEVMEEEIAEVMPEVLRRWEWLDKEELIKRVVSREFGRFLQYYADAPEIEEIQTSKEVGSRGSKGSREAEAGYTRLFLNLGKIDGFYAREIITLINRTVRDMDVAIGKIDLTKSCSFVEIASDQAQAVIKAFKHGVTVKGRSIVLDEADGAPKGSKSGTRERGKSGSREVRNQRSRERRTSESRRSGRREERKEERRQGRRESQKDSKERKYGKEDWMQFFQHDDRPLKGTEPDFTEEGWARRKPKKK